MIVNSDPERGKDPAPFCSTGGTRRPASEVKQAAGAPIARSRGSASIGVWAILGVFPPFGPTPVELRFCLLTRAKRLANGLTVEGSGVEWSALADLDGSAGPGGTAVGEAREPIGGHGKGRGGGFRVSGDSYTAS